MENIFPPKNENFIPPGPYCYHFLVNEPDPVTHKMRILRCPYWAKNEEKETQESGYCEFLETGDWIEGGSFSLWDQLKECGIDLDADYFMEQEFQYEYYQKTLKWIDSIYEWVKAKEDAEYMKLVDNYRKTIVSFIKENFAQK